jgi:hypothetical protein
MQAFSVFHKALIRSMATVAAICALVGLSSAKPPPAPAPTINYRGKQTPPVKMGTSGGAAIDLANGYCCGGTLGSLVTDGTTQYILSNFHVLAADTAAGGNNIVSQIGDAVIQPGLIDVGCNSNKAQVVGTLAGWADPILGANVDAAIAQVVSGMVDSSGAILGIGTLSSSTVFAFPGQAVKKSGRTTGLTSSSVSAISATISVAYDTECAGTTRGTAVFHGQVVVKNKGSKFLAAGDSGSLMVENVSSNPRAVGLLYAGSSTTAIANPIGDVLAALNVTMVGAAGTAAGQSLAEPGPDFKASVKRATEARDRHARALEHVPGWVGNGVGIDAAGRPVIKVFVEKLTPESLAAVPDSVDGIPVEVEETGRIVAF